MSGQKDIQTEPIVKRIWEFLRSLKHAVRVYIRDPPEQAFDTRMTGDVEIIPIVRNSLKESDVGRITCDRATPFSDVKESCLEHILYPRES